MVEFSVPTQSRAWLKYLSSACALAFAVCGAAAAHAATPEKTVVIDGTGVFPESFDSSSSGALYIGSIANGIVYRALPGQGKAEPWLQKDANGLLNILGVVVDEHAGILWVCSSDPAPGRPATTVKAFDLTSGALKQSYPFPGRAQRFRHSAGRDHLCFRYAERPYPSRRKQWHSVELAEDPQLMGIDGITFVGGTLYANTVTTSHLFRIDRKPDGTAGAVTQLQLSQPIMGPDGMRPGPDGKILLAENKAGRVDLVTVNGNNASIEVFQDNIANTPTAMSLSGTTVWISESKFNYRSDPNLKGKDPGEFDVYAFPLNGSE